MLHEHVGENPNVRSPKQLPVSQGVLGFTFDDSLVCDIGTGVDIDPNEVQFGSSGDPKGRVRVVSEAVDPHWEGEAAFGLVGDQGQRSDLMRRDPIAVSAFVEWAGPEVLDDDPVGATLSEGVCIDEGPS